MASRLRPLPDYLRSGLSVVFAGANPGVISAQRGHYYANPRNQFWSLLHASGLVDEKLRPEDDARVLEHGIGLTDLVKRPSRGIADLTPQEKRAGAIRLRNKLHHWRPCVVCFNGLEVYKGYADRRGELGLHENEDPDGAPIFVVPSTSSQNTHWTFRDKLDYFRELKRIVDREVSARRDG